ncbi:motility associated factor glycosyltransferase family protein [Sulfuricurvum sp.]|uniref:motility associated factor glycosyltransferase family protein n=1 Tax=Sulfuricurvum sp. TaxID=2025608 RepID=UPI002E34773C|nr:6-hydroxymethylpterin diphosphokinase MptE-like protein [Sulfuricurvum sp.]HEX5329003.1 6-hydroxymethylpterin diphosphokinase MptE-like protein [Sulfuricurvum sp.]
MSESTTSLHPVFEKNLQALFHKNAYLATDLFKIEGNTRFEVYQGKDAVDINLYDTENKSIFYNTPVQDVIDFIDNSRKEYQLPFRYFFGMGNGIIIQMLLKDPEIKRIIVIEPNLEILYIILHMLDFSESILNDRLFIESYAQFSYPKADYFLTSSQSQFYAKLFDLETTSHYYSQYYEEDMRDVISIMTKAFETTILGYGNSAEDSLMGIEHHIKNLPAMVHGPKIVNLQGQKHPDIAVVVSTGPSLTKQIPLLKKIQDYVTIICVDASFPILEKHGIKPDFVTVLERIPETANFFKKNEKEFQDDVIFVCVSIVHEDILKAIRGGTTVLQMRPHDYTKYFGLDDYGYLGSGMSAANLAHELGMALKFKNIVLIGQDLAFGDDNTSHANDHTFGVNEEDSSKHDFYVERYGGNGEIRTTHYWIMFKNHFEQAIARQEAPQRTINATEGGARIPGSIEMPFSEVVETLVDFTQHKDTFHLDPTPQEEAEKHITTIVDKINFWLSDSIEKQNLIETIFLEVQKACEEFVKFHNEKKLDKITMKKLTHLTDRIDEVKALTEDNLFIQLYFQILQSSLLHYELDFSVIQAKVVKDEEDKKAKLLEWVMAHRYWLFAFAGQINAEREIIQRAILTWPEEIQSRIVIPVKDDIEVSI